MKTTRQSVPQWRLITVDKTMTVQDGLDMVNKQIHETEVFLETQPDHKMADEAAKKLGEMRALRDHLLQRQQALQN